VRLIRFLPVLAGALLCGLCARAASGQQSAPTIAAQPSPSVVAQSAPAQSVAPQSVPVQPAASQSAPPSAALKAAAAQTAAQKAAAGKSGSPAAGATSPAAASQVTATSGAPTSTATPAPAAAATASASSAATNAGQDDAQAPLPDPTRPDDRVLRYLRAGGAGTSSATLVGIALRGIVVSAAGSASAVIEVGDRLVHLAPGNEFALDASGMRRARVVSLDASGVLIEDATTAERIRLN
jgi:hypothetical protein